MLPFVLNPLTVVKVNSGMYYVYFLGLFAYTYMHEDSALSQRQEAVLLQELVVSHILECR